MDSVVTPTIQILDDDPFILKLLAQMLDRQGFSNVEASSSARVVLEQITAGHFCPDLILLDLNMPEMDGLAFIRELAELEYPGSVLLISGEEESIVQCSVKLTRAHRINILGQMSKPVEPLQLAGVLDEWRSALHLKVEAERQLAQKSYSVAELHAALRNGELINYYQPKVAVASGRLQGAEALVRWRHPLDGMIAPDLFIPLAEQHDLIDELTRQVVANALADIKHWRSNGLSLKVAINISMESLVSIGFMDSICKEVAEAQVSPEELSFEVTESRLQTDERNPLEVLTRLRLHHFDLALDDFGTGFATFCQLSDFPFTELKVDQRFVHGAATDASVRNFYHASLSLAREFGLDVVAEGVEDRVDWDFVRASGDICAQGFFIARPMAAANLHGWLFDWQKRLTRERLIPQEEGEYVI
ncbi:EAL domain-containing protein [Pontibacterium sp.]|uniref:EAL domain-containing response regulator n=1 Tax=Pontibacterium sp. TaxID=2036026 RepID=UPI0035660CEE